MCLLPQKHAWTPRRLVYYFRGSKDAQSFPCTLCRHLLLGKSSKSSLLVLCDSKADEIQMPLSMATGNALSLVCSLVAVVVNRWPIRSWSYIISKRLWRVEMASTKVLWMGGVEGLNAAWMVPLSLLRGTWELVIKGDGEMDLYRCRSLRTSMQQCHCVMAHLISSCDAFLPGASWSREEARDCIQLSPSCQLG